LNKNETAKNNGPKYLISSCRTGINLTELLLSAFQELNNQEKMQIYAINLEIRSQ